MISMTGFAFREWASDDISVFVEIKGYNNRFLEVYVSMPSWLSHLEPKVRDLIGNYCSRGKVEISIRLKDQNTPLNICVNTAAAKSYLQAINSLAENLGINDKLNMAELIKMEGVLEIEKKRDNERYWNLIEPVLDETAQLFQSERIREGKDTEENILNEINNIELALGIIEKKAPELDNLIKENITARFRELSGNAAGAVIDENRILGETAILLIKYTISEEISRLSSHIAEFKAETARNKCPGKKLDFLCQEINREVNTIGSKSTILEASHAVVDMKESLENIREQLRNIE